MKEIIITLLLTVLWWAVYAMVIILIDLTPIFIQKIKDRCVYRNIK
jgi:hypothetical protein